MTDPLGPTGNTASVCRYCGEAHEPRLTACSHERLRRRIAELQSEIDRPQKDTDRLRWLAGCDDDGPVIEGFTCLYDDFWNYLGDAIRERIGEDNDDGSDEGTPDDRLTAFRNMIDDAIKTEKERTL